ncbi:TetR/AcrR family transcriptional regulator [Pusillimonas caeni]|uniref:TetR/AcrR family transcriptional regulator n=1 Tax=Pusillimonas caeni TaxID=1348472 RepID=UPI000E5A023C|nr:TetR/AcrR family transcriptional regulator [Pusillimonas caeni]TFL08842.1 TetR/AcrR family transcriptional regulator [Pusillimonas caeni]
MVQIRKAEVEQAIVCAARELFMQHGYAGTRVPQVARAAGVSPANIYVYFSSKLELLARVYEQWFAERLDELRAALAHCATPDDKLRKIVMAVWRDLPAADNGFCNSLIEALSAPGSKEKYSSSLRVVVERGLADMLAECLPALAREQHRALARFLLMAFDGYALNYHLNDGETASEEDVAFLCAMMRGYAP